MLNEEKIILMTKLAIYEKGEGKKEIPMSRYYRNDYVGVHMLYTFLSVTAGYVLLFALYIARDVEEFLSSLTTMDLKKFLFTALAIYLGAELFFLFVTWILYRYRFKKNRQHLNEYYGNLKRLKKLQKKEQEAAMKMVEGKEAEGGKLPKEDTDDNINPEDAEEDDIFQEPEQQGYFRRRRAERAAEGAAMNEGEDSGEDLDSYDDEDADLYGDEETDLYGDESADLYDDKGTDSYDDEGVDLYDDEDMDPYKWEEGANDTGLRGEKSADVAMDLYGKENSGKEQNFGNGKDAENDRILHIKQEGGGQSPNVEEDEDEDIKLYIGKHAGTGEMLQSKAAKKPETDQANASSLNANSESAPDQDSEQDPDFAMEQALKKMILDSSEDDEEDEDGFTFSS